MQAIRVHPAPEGASPYSPSNPAPTSALHLDHDVPIPKPTQPGELVVRVKASTAVRDMLTWPEIYYHEYTIPGNDLSGIVVTAHDANSKFKPGDEIFGMAHAERGAVWAEYTIAKETEIGLKPAKLSWEEAAAVPLSAQTAYEALFDHAGVALPGGEDALKNISKEHPRAGRKVLITGAAGGVGVYLVQLAAFAGLHVTAATSSNDRNAEFLRELGADETIEYSSLSERSGVYDIIIDTVGGEPLVQSWGSVKEGGSIISVDSSSYDFVAEHERRGLSRKDVKALFFIVEGGTRGLHNLAHLADLGILRVFVLETYPLAKAREAYEHASGRGTGRGKIVITV